VTPECQPHLDRLFSAAQAKLLEPADFCVREALVREFSEWLAAPQIKRAPQ
jgi:hypothetical protein